MIVKKPINVALVGFGFSGSTFHAPFLRKLEEYNLCTVVSSNLEKVRENLPHVSVEPDFTKALHSQDLDIVVIAIPSAKD